MKCLSSCVSIAFSVNAFTILAHYNHVSGNDVYIEMYRMA